MTKHDDNKTINAISRILQNIEQAAKENELESLHYAKNQCGYLMDILNHQHAIFAAVSGINKAIKWSEENVDHFDDIPF